MEVEFKTDQPVEINPPAPDQKLEEYLEDVGASLNEMNRFVYEAYVDGEPVGENEREKKCQHFGKLEIEARSYEAMTIDSIGQLGEYCQSFLARLPGVVETWEDKGEEEQDQLRRQVLEALELSGNVLGSTGDFLNVEDAAIEKLKERSEQIAADLRDSSREELKGILEEECGSFFTELLETLRKILNKISDRQLEVEDKLGSLDEEIDELAGALRGLIEDLQSGGEAENYENLEERVGDVESILETILLFDSTGQLKQSFEPQRQDKLADAHEELQDGLQELQQALEDDDVIMICDILEYELLPYLETIKKLFEDHSPEA